MLLLITAAWFTLPPIIKVELPKEYLVQNRYRGGPFVVIAFPLEEVRVA